MAAESASEQRLREVEQNNIRLQSTSSQLKDDLEDVESKIEKLNAVLNGDTNGPGLVERVSANDSFRKRWVGIFSGIITTVLGAAAVWFVTKKE